MVYTFESDFVFITVLLSYGIHVLCVLNIMRVIHNANYRCKCMKCESVAKPSMGGVNLRVNLMSIIMCMIDMADHRARRGTNT